MGARFSFTGTKEMKAKLQAVLRNLPKEAERALYQEGEVDMTESKKICPVYSPDEGVTPTHVGGTLRASGHVRPPEREGRRISVDLVYGGAAEAYAIVQHERTDFHHNVGQAKYLESVIMASAPFMNQRLAKRLKLDDPEMIK